MNILNETYVLRIEEASSAAHLDKVELGYESMDHYKVDFKKEGKALRSIDFIQGKGTEITTLNCFTPLIVVVLQPSSFFALILTQMTKMRMKKMRLQEPVLRKEKDHKLFLEVLFQPPLPSLLHPHSR